MGVLPFPGISTADILIIRCKSGGHFRRWVCLRVSIPTIKITFESAYVRLFWTLRSFLKIEQRKTDCVIPEYVNGVCNFY